MTVNSTPRVGEDAHAVPDVDAEGDQPECELADPGPQLVVAPLDPLAVALEAGRRPVAVALGRGTHERGH